MLNGNLADLADVKAVIGAAGTPLTAGASASDTTITVLSTESFPADAGVLSIDDEVVSYTGKTATSFTGLTRGYLGTQATSHDVEARVSRYADDASLRRLIASASAWVKRAISDELLEETLSRQPYSGTGTQTLMLKRRPVQIVSEVRVDGAVIPRSGSPMEAGWMHDERAVYLRGSYQFHFGVRNVEVSYTGGYPLDELSADVRELVADAVNQTLLDRDRKGISSQSLAGETIAYFDRIVTARGRDILEGLLNVVPLA